MIITSALILGALQWGGAVLGVLSCLIVTSVPKHVVLGMGLSTLACATLAIWGLSTLNYGIFASQAIYAVLYVVGFYSWRKEVKNGKKES